MNKTYPIQLEISGPTAMWTRPDTGDAPVSYLAPTYSAADSTTYVGTVAKRRMK